MCVGSLPVEQRGPEEGGGGGEGTLTHLNTQTGTGERWVDGWGCLSLMARFHRAVRFGTVQYAIISVSTVRSCEWYQIVNRTVPLFWYPSVGVPRNVVLRVFQARM